MKRSAPLVLILASLLIACSTPTGARGVSAKDSPAPRTLTVFAAASLTGAFSEIGKAFEAANPNVTVTFNFAGSSGLRTQIEQGASADVFASADRKNMDTMVGESLIAGGKYQDFATNQLVVILPPNNPANHPPSPAPPPHCRTV